MGKFVGRAGMCCHDKSTSMDNIDLLNQLQAVLQHALVCHASGRRPGTQ
jgi:hypothetical protein